MRISNGFDKLQDRLAQVIGRGIKAPRQLECFPFHRMGDVGAVLEEALHGALKNLSDLPKLAGGHAVHATLIFI